MADDKSYMMAAYKGLSENDPLHINLIYGVGNTNTELLTEIPFEKLGDLSKIKSIHLKDQKIRKISSRIGELTSLDYFYISDTPIEELPEEIGNLKELKLLCVSEIFETETFEYLNRLLLGPRHEATFKSPAGLKTLPESFGKLRKLVNLNLEANRFTEIPPPIFNLTALDFLDLSRNFITHVSGDIGKLTNLRYLKLSRNNFHELPDSIGNLKKLERLRLDSLDLTGLPAGIGGLESLKMLEICQGCLQSIPLEIQQLKQLEDLYLVDTEIDETDLTALRIFLPHTRIHTSMDYLDEDEEDDDEEEAWENEN